MAAAGGFALADALLVDAGKYLTERRHAEAVLSIARAFEVALAASTAAVLLTTPERTRTNAAEIDMLHRRYMTTIGGMSPTALRNVVMAMVIRQIRPQTIAEALEFVEQSRRTAAVMPAREHVAAIQDKEARAAVEALRDASIIDLCCRVVHLKYHPSEREIEEHGGSVGKLCRALGDLFRAVPQKR